MSPDTPARGADSDQLFESASTGDRVALARLISMIERGGLPARQLARLTFPLTGQGYSVGITGAPGSGKSSLTDRLIALIRSTKEAGGHHTDPNRADSHHGHTEPGDAEGGDSDRGHAGHHPAGNDYQTVGVLAVDPTSPFSGGAILGDRVRMQGHAGDDAVFIRSMATRGHLGGLALAVPECMRLLDALGFSVVLVETVGVGQVEVEVAEATDTTVVVVNPGWGDSVQANKAGILEIADVFVVNKADRPGVAETVRDLGAMLDLSKLEGWRPPIVTTVASTGEGIDELWKEIESHQRHLLLEGLLQERREERLEKELTRIVANRLLIQGREALSSPSFQSVLFDMHSRRVDPYEAANLLLQDLGVDES